MQTTGWLRKLALETDADRFLNVCLPALRAGTVTATSYLVVTLDNEQKGVTEEQPKAGGPTTPPSLPETVGPPP